MSRRADLIALLTGYSPDDPDEQRYRIEMLDLAAVADDPFDRYSYEPGHFTASGFVIHPEGDRLLLIEHAKIGAWLQPGGHIDPDDATTMAGALREIAEETGVAAPTPVTDALVDIDIHVFPERSDQPRHLHYDVRFAFVAVDAEFSINHEAEAARWVRVDQMGALGVDRSVLRPAGKLLDQISSGP